MFVSIDSLAAQGKGKGKKGWVKLSAIAYGLPGVFHGFQE